MLDLWFENDVKPCLAGSAFLIRYADDFAIGFSDQRDAQRVMEVIPKRFWQVRSDRPSNQDETRSPFRPPSSKTKDRNGPDDRPGTFDLLGFTHYWAVSMKGYWVVKLKTASDRFSRAVRGIDQWCHDNRHLPIAEQATQG